MVKKMITYQIYKVVRNYGKFTDLVRCFDYPELAVDFAVKLYRKDREQGHQYKIECWDQIFKDEELEDEKFNSTIWDSNKIPPWKEI